MAESLLETDKSSVVEIRPISHSQDHLLPGKLRSLLIETSRTSFLTGPKRLMVRGEFFALVVAGHDLRFGLNCKFPNFSRR